jgi:uncharacterized membrane protein YfcA
VIGAVIGSVSALSLEDTILRRLFAGFLILTALRMLLPKAWFQRRGSPPELD